MCVCVCVCVFFVLYMTSQGALMICANLDLKVCALYICMVYEVESKKYLDGYEMDWCHFVLLKKTSQKKGHYVWRVFVVFFLHIPPPPFILNQDLRDSVGGEISVPRQLCSNSQTLNHYPFNNLKSSLKIIAHFPSMNQGERKKGGGRRRGAEKGKAETCGSRITGTQILILKRPQQNKGRVQDKSCGVMQKKKKKNSKHPTKGGGGEKARKGYENDWIEKKVKL